MSKKAASHTNNATYVVYESHYYYCDTCGRKSYREGAVANQPCNAFNSSPAKYPLKHCPGKMVSSSFIGGPVTEVYERETS